MRFAAIAVVLLMSAGLLGEVLARSQTDWYSRGIVRTQTIKVMTAKQKRQQYLKRKKRKAHRTQPRHTH